jgi:hypothetical protein
LAVLVTICSWAASTPSESARSVAAESFSTPCAAIVLSVSNCGMTGTKASAAWKVALALVVRPSRSVCVSVAV